MGALKYDIKKCRSGIAELRTLGENMQAQFDMGLVSGSLIKGKGSTALKFKEINGILQKIVTLTKKTIDASANTIESALAGMIIADNEMSKAVKNIK